MENSIKIYDGFIADKNTELHYDLERLDEWFDHCPVEGISNYRSDKSCLNHWRIIDNGEFFTIISKPNFTEGKCDYYKRLVICKLVKDDMWKYINKFNLSPCIYKFGEDDQFENFPVDEETLIILSGFSEIVMDLFVEDSESCEKLLDVINIKNLYYHEK